MSQDRAADERDLAKLEEILQFAARVRELDKSPRWKSDLEGVMDDHGAAVEALYTRLNEMLDIRASRGQPVVSLKPSQDLKKQLKVLLVRALRQTLPAVLKDTIESTIEGLEL